MINMECVSAEIGKTAEKLDRNILPETWNYLYQLMGENGLVTETPCRIAGAVMECDKPKRFPRFLISLVRQLYELEIAEGNDDAMNDLGACYYDGSRGFPQSFGKAVHYYELAVEHGSRQAQENLGYCYYYGRDMQPDYEKAFHYFALGAFDGHLISLYKIGDMYLNGYYVKKNEVEAFAIYMHCFETMKEEAEPFVGGPIFLRLGKMFLRGLGTEQNLKNALICYQKAESFLYDMVRNGDIKYKTSLEAAIRGQQETRELLRRELPEGEWFE